MHGHTSLVFHSEDDLFRKIPSPFTAVRYHSLVARDLPDCIRKIAWTEDEVVMAVRHITRPLWGVQFHPESICTEYGRRLIENYYDLTEQFRGSHRPRSRTNGNGKARGNGKLRVTSTRSKNGTRRMSGASVRYRKLPFYPDSETAYVNLFGSAQPAFWLDSSLVVEGLSRYSFMGACTPENG